MEPRKSAEQQDQFFEPMERCRAFTWHGNLNEYGVRDSSADTVSPEVVIKSEVQESGGCHKDDALNLKKPSTRRNAWGCMSYADLITKAIESVPDKRLTLSQIYGWMIQNVPYFKDKGESNSSAGWKNSIRHNLSLHRKFTRVQNEGTGKSSWWMVNKDANTCKSPRRRASSMDNKMYEKKKHRQTAPMSSIEERNSASDYAQSNVVPSSSSSSEVLKLDSFATAFSPVDLRVNGRVLSSSHLTPIEQVSESAFDNEVMTQPSPLYWNQCHSVNPPYGQPPESLTETVGESLAELFTPDMSTGGYKHAFSPDHRLTLLQNLNEKYVSEPGYGSFQDLGGGGAMPSPPPYAGHPADQHCMSGEGGLFPQAEICPKEFLQQSPVSSPRSDTYPAASSYGAGHEFGQVQTMQMDDVAAMQYYATDRISEGFAPRADDNSVLRRMLMQKNTLLQPRFGDGTPEPVVKSEPASCDDSFAYPEAQSTTLCSGAAPSNSAYGDSIASRQVGNAEFEQGASMTDFDTEDGNRIVKQESCSSDAWEFSMTSLANGAIANSSEN